METVSASLAHDVGHELATVAFLVTAVRGDPGLSPQNRRRLDLVEREVTRLQELVGHRIDDVVGPEVSLATLVTEVVDPLALSSAGTVTATVEADVRLRVDPRALWRLLANLVGNAIRAAGPDGTVRVHVPDRRPPAIEVHDDGPGPGGGPPGHAGSGLATSRGLAARCGADLTLAAAPPGGTVARISFGSPSGTVPGGASA